MKNRFNQKENLLKIALAIFAFYLLIESLLNYFLYEEFIRAIVYFQFFILSAVLSHKLKDKKTMKKSVEITIIIVLLFIGFLYIDELKNIVLPMILF